MVRSDSKALPAKPGLDARCIFSCVLNRLVPNVVLLFRLAIHHGQIRRRGAVRRDIHFRDMRRGGLKKLIP